MAVIDTHTHFLPYQWPDLEERYGSADWPWLKHTSQDRAMLMVGEKEFRPVYSACWDIERRLQEMDRDHIDQQIMCATPLLFGYQRDAAHADDCARLFNDLSLEMCSRSHGRIMSLAQVPLQNTDLACREIERAMGCGHLGVQIGNHVGDRDLDDEGLITFLQHCADVEAPVLIHPWDMLGRERMNRHMLQWLVAMPAETQLSILHLILSGAFERLPRSLKLCFAHGGGSFAYLLGRVDNAWLHRDIVREHCPQLPSSYTDRFSVDSAVFDPGALRLLVDVMGPDRVMLGTDYPFPLGEQKMGHLVRSAQTLSETEKTKILEDNPKSFFFKTNTRSSRKI